MDVYVDILPAAKRSFVSVRRIFKSLFMTGLDLVGKKIRILPRLNEIGKPGMNISYILDGIMDESNGIRPLDPVSFRENEKKQPLKVVTSCARDGKLKTKCFGTEEFYGEDQILG